MTTTDEKELSESYLISDRYLGQQFTDSELVIGLVSAVGTENKKVIDKLHDRFKIFEYTAKDIRISTESVSSFSVSVEKNDE